MGNRQGGRMTPRPDFFSQQKHVKRTEKLDGSNGDQDALSPQIHAAVFLSTGVHCGGAFHSPPDYALRAKIEAGSTLDTDKDPNFVSMIFQEEKHVVSCPPHEHGPVDRRADVSTANGGDPSEVTRAQTAVPSPSARRRDVLKPSNFETDPDKAKAELTVPQICSGLPSSVSFPKHRCLKADPVIKVGDGVKSSAAVLTAACIDRLDYLKRNIEQRSTEHLTHFNNTGFAQLQCEAGYDDYDNTNDSKVPDARAHRRSKSMSPKTAAMMGTPQTDDKTKSTAIRKLSEPGHRVHRTNSTIPGVWSKSAENSPVIVRKALPNPGNPLIVQRTPSQSPSVERRFPANAPASSVILGNGAYSADALKPRQHVYQKLSFQHQDCLESRDTSFSIRQKVIAEISLPRLSNSPVSARKMPESPVLLSSGIQHQGKDSGRENPPTTTADERSMLDWTPFGTYRAHCKKTPPTLSSCSSSSSESPQGKLPWREDNVSLSIPLGTSSTSSSSATPCSSPPTPILFCPQPKGTPVRTCTIVSQPSTAVVLAGRDRQRNPQAMEVGVPPRDIQTGDQTTTVPQDDRRDAQAVSAASSHEPPASSVVTEDTIKQNSQSAVFGSVSPKLLRHRRLIKNNSNHSHDQHTFPKHSHSVHAATAKTSPRKGDNSLLFIGDTACSDSCEHVHSSGDERLVQLSQSAPSSFSLHGSAISGSCVGNKTLGQRIREVINEATVGARLNRDTSSVSFRKQTSVFSKDDIFTRTSASVKSSLYSGPYINKRQRLLCDQTLSVRHEHVTGLTGERREAKTADEHRTKVPSSHASSKDTMEEHPHKISGHSYHLNSSRDSCASCVSDSSQMEFFDGTCFPNEVADLTQANLCRQAHWLTEGARSKQQVVLSAQLGAPGHRLVTSDTSDTLSTDRDTSSSSKRESSTSTATDDTLTSFKTRSTADSADYDEGFVLPEGLVFIRSADKDAPDDMCAFDSEQTTIKRKLIQRQLHESRAEQELLPHKTRKKRRKQVHVQSQIITATPQQTGGTLTRHRTVREVYSDVISDDSDLSDSKDDISDLPSSRDDISDLPSSRDDISDLPSSRDDISDLPSSRNDISDVLSSRDNISDFACRETRPAGGFSTAYTFSDTGTVQRCVFHRSDLQSSAKPIPSSVFERKSAGGKPATPRCDTSTDLSDSDTHGICDRGSSSSQGSRVTLSRLPGHVGDSGTVLSECDGRRVTSGPGGKATCLAVLSTHSTRSESAKRLTAAPLAKTNQILRAERQDGCERVQDTSVSTYDENKGKQLLLQNPESPGSDDTVVLTYTVYNSSCQSVGACD